MRRLASSTPKPQFVAEILPFGNPSVRCSYGPVALRPHLTESYPFRGNIKTSETYNGAGSEPFTQFYAHSTAHPSQGQ